jgi:hypothetical protein
VRLKKLIVAQVVKFPAFSESEVSLPCFKDLLLLHIHSKINPVPILLRTVYYYPLSQYVTLIECWLKNVAQNMMMRRWNNLPQRLLL